MRRALVIGPADAGSDGGGGRGGGHAHVNVWRLRDAGASPDDTAARVIATALARQPGFVSYALVRTSSREVVAVTIFETEDALQRAVRAVAPVVREHVAPLSAARPERRSGPVVHYRAAAR